MSTGQKVCGYTLDTLLASGSTGTVYSATDPCGQKVAVKVMPPPKGDSAVTVFQREVRIGQTLDHPSIVQTLHTFAHGPAQYVIMELVEGTNLRSVLGKPMDTERFLAIFEPLTEGLARAHSKGVVHRDLRPENVILTADGSVKILGFGLARLVQEGAMAMPGPLKGVVSYSAPEQMADSKRSGPAGDQYALGIMMVEAMSGEFPFIKHEAPLQEILERGKGETPRLAELEHGFSEQVYQVFARMLAPEPADRYPDVREACQALKAAILSN
ncbi:MAG: serine/threonine-protein kinase [Vulcanimicrobiota bacterium]